MECKFSHEEIDCPSTRLSHVCAGWRELARSIPILWSHINIDLFWVPSIRCSVDMIGRMLTTHLELSRNLPLSVALKVPASPESQITEIINLLASHSHRWQDLDFEGDVAHLWSDGSFASIEGNLPRLQSLSLLFRIWEESSPLSRNVDIFHDAPQLRVVRYNRRSPEYTVKFPWTQITDFTSQYSWCSLALEDLYRVPMADKITFYCCDTRQRALPPFVTPATMPFRSLSIYVEEFFSFRLFQWFRRLTLPNLEILQLFGASYKHRDHPNSRFTIEDLPSFISRSSCTIRTLTFSKLALSDKDVIAALRSFPMLSKLTIHERHYGDYGKNMAVTDDFLKHLTVDHGNLKRGVDQSFLSRLEALDLRIHAPFATEKLVHMIQSRWIPDQKHSDRIEVVSLLSFNLMVLYEREVIGTPTAGLQMLDTLKADGLEYKLAVEALTDHDKPDYSDDSEVIED
ncbi:hypothetical protein K435DRAFT_488177 [Dendrothele bispora CBS 962.96]|uniref:F-box domain-containing protein n=1 Tax=Dendrothele bispora (strain CBS 962.96) TaxID=1314807 RepID=A0A4S8KY80_DENBC|nr:hypothetical protein K435DRAFT_488177 [Dendrothele bispora CBS 962.96]